MLVAHHRALPARRSSTSAELARVATADGTALVITPNRPADFENPFHVSLFEADELESLLALFFDDVTVHGLEGSPELHADFAQRRASGETLLKLDPFDLRHKVPYSWYVWGYEHVLPVVYKVLGSARTGIGSGLDESHFFLTDQITPTTPGCSRSPATRAAELLRPETYLAHRPRESGRSVSSTGSGSPPATTFSICGVNQLMTTAAPAELKWTPSPRIT